MECKFCKHCSKEKPLDTFVKSKTTKSGYRGICRDCFNAYYAKRRIEKYEQVRAYEKKFHFERRLRYEYGITPQQLEEMKKEQGDACKICSVVAPLVIDHCHTSTKVRGLLCNKCNMGLGLFSDNPQTLQTAINYLKDNYD